MRLKRCGYALKMMRELKDNFCERMQEQIDAAPAYDFIFIIGDVNAKVGSCYKGRDQLRV